MADLYQRFTLPYSDLSPEQRLRACWHDFCDADPVPVGFLDEMEAVGFVECVPVTADALEDPFAAERGIEPGGMMWALTAIGRAALKEQTP